jgi:hypothetical protein
MKIPVFEIELSLVPVGAVHELGHGDMTTIADRFTSMKEEELHLASVVEPLLVSDEVVVVIE